MSSASAVIPRTRVFCGSPGEIRNVRSFVGQVINERLDADDVILLASELAANAVRHTASGAGGTFSVSVFADDLHIRVEIYDSGSATPPAVRRPDAPGESGAGLRLVEVIADRWGFWGGQHGRVVWFEMGRRGAGISGVNQPATRCRCSCGFIAGDAEDFCDHLRVEFAAADDMGADGHQHYELADTARRADCFPAAHACACGFPADDATVLDDHLLGVFLTPGNVGADGQTHMLADFTTSYT